MALPAAEQARARANDLADHWAKKGATRLAAAKKWVQEAKVEEQRRKQLGIYMACFRVELEEAGIDATTLEHLSWRQRREVRRQRLRQREEACGGNRSSTARPWQRRLDQERAQRRQQLLTQPVPASAAVQPAAARGHVLAMAGHTLFCRRCAGRTSGHGRFSVLKGPCLGRPDKRAWTLDYLENGCDPTSKERLGDVRVARGSDFHQSAGGGGGGGRGGQQSLAVGPSPATAVARDLAAAGARRLAAACDVGGGC